MERRAVYGMVIWYSSPTVYSSRTRVRVFRTRTRTRRSRPMTLSHIPSYSEPICLRNNSVASTTSLIVCATPSEV